jgi:hypothetical protein
MGCSVSKNKCYYEVLLKIYPSYGHFCIPIDVAIVRYQYYILLLCS